MLQSDRHASVQQALAANATRMRERAGWTRQQAAEAMGIDLKHLQKLEYGKLNPSLRTLVNVAGAGQGSCPRTGQTPKGWGYRRGYVP
jgi:transcriptional regulator with XRE-family HTH domain